MSWPIGYVAADVGGLAAAELADVLARAGYAAVDWTMEQFDPLVEEPAALERLARTARDAGLLTPQLMVHQDYVTADEREWERRVRRSELAVDAAAQAGIASVGVVTGPNGWVDGHARVGVDIGEGQAWSAALRALERVVERAHGSGVAVALEPCWGTLARDRYRAEHVLARFAPEELGVTVDPSHFVMSGDDVAQMVRDWSARLRHVHLKDAFGASGEDGVDFCFLLPGEGRVDWPGLLDALDEVGYDGATSVEFEAFTLREGPLGGSVEEGAQLALRLAHGVLAARERAR